MVTKKKPPQTTKGAAKPARSKKRYQPTAEQQLQTGMPATDSVRSVVKAKSPGGKKFEILKTNERDSYDR